MTVPSLGLLSASLTLSVSCNEDQQNKLRSIFVESSAIASGRAWKVSETFLCAERSDKNINDAMSSSKSKIKNNYEEAGVQPGFELGKSTKDTIKSLMANGNAWDVEILASKDKLEVNYLRDEACIEGLTFHFHDGQWYLSKFSAACD